MLLLSYKPIEMSYMKRKRGFNLIYVSVADLAAQYGFHPNTVRAWAHRDGLPFIKRGKGGKMYFLRTDVQSFIDRYYGAE